MWEEADVTSLYEKLGKLELFSHRILQEARAWWFMGESAAKGEIVVDVPRRIASAHRR